MLKVILGKVFCNTKKYSSASQIKGTIAGTKFDGFAFYN